MELMQQGCCPTLHNTNSQTLPMCSSLMLPQVDIKMPDIDLSHLPGHPDVLLDIKPMIKMPHSLDKMPKPAKANTKVCSGIRAYRVVHAEGHDQNVLCVPSCACCKTCDIISAWRCYAVLRCWQVNIT